MNVILLNLQKAHLRKITVDNVNQIFSNNFCLFTLRQSDLVLYKGNEIPKTIVDRGKFEILIKNTGNTSDFQCSNTIAGKRITNAMFAEIELKRINDLFEGKELNVNEQIKLKIYTDYLETKLNEIDRFELIESWQKIINKNNQELNHKNYIDYIDGWAKSRKTMVKSFPNYETHFDLFDAINGITFGYLFKFNSFYEFVLSHDIKDRFASNVFLDNLDDLLEQFQKLDCLIEPIKLNVLKNKTEIGIQVKEYAILTLNESLKIIKNCFHIDLLQSPISKEIESIINNLTQSLESVSLSKAIFNTNQEFEHPFLYLDNFELLQFFIENWKLANSERSRYTYMFDYFTQLKKELFSQKQFFEFIIQFTGIKVGIKRQPKAIRGGKNDYLMELEALFKLKKSQQS